MRVTRAHRSGASIIGAQASLQGSLLTCSDIDLVFIMQTLINFAFFLLPSNFLLFESCPVLDDRDR